MKHVIDKFFKVEEMTKDQELNKTSYTNVFSLSDKGLVYHFCLSFENVENLLTVNVDGNNIIEDFEISYLSKATVYDLETNQSPLFSLDGCTLIMNFPEPMQYDSNFTISIKRTSNSSSNKALQAGYVVYWSK